MIKTQLQLVCCALIWELGCLGISESRKEGVSRVGYGQMENLDWEQRDCRGYELGF